MPSELDPLTRRVCERTALSDKAVNHAIRETVTAFAARLPADLCSRLSAGVPGPWRDAFESRPDACAAGPVDDLYLEVANALSLPPGEALELAQVIVGELASGLNDDQRRRARADLPEDWAALLTPPVRAHAVPPRDGPPPQPGSVGDTRGNPNRIAASPGPTNPISSTGSDR